jgi:hypothetical protein
MEELKMRTEYAEFELADTEGISTEYERYTRELVASTEEAHRRALQWDADAPTFDVDTSELDEFIADATGLDMAKRKEFHKVASDVQRRELEAYLEHYESEVRPRLVELDPPEDERYRPEITPAALDSKTHQAVPVSTIVVASDADLLPEAGGDTEVHNPYTKTFGATARQGIWIKNVGSGDGLRGLIPHFIKGIVKTVHWNFLYKPGPVASNLGWRCWADLILRGTYSCFVNDGKYSSKYAGLELSTSLQAVPLHPISYVSTVATVTDEMQLLNIRGQNVHVEGTVDIAPALFVEPQPWVQQAIHAVTVSVTALALWRGYSHTLLDFEHGWIKGDDRFYEPGAFCLGASVKELGQLWSP